MLKQLAIIIGKFAALFFLGGVVLALFFPAAARFLNPDVGYILMIVLFLGFLTTDYSIAISELKNWKYQLYLLLLGMIIVPTLFYWLALGVGVAFGVGHGFAVAVLVLYATSTAAVAPVLCLLFGGRIERAQLNMLAATLIVAITLPVLCYLLLGARVHFNILTIAGFIIKIIFIPLVLAIIVRRLVPKLTMKVKPVISPLSVLLVAIIIFASAENLRSLLFGAMHLALIAAALGICCYFIGIGIGLVLAFKHDRASKVTVALIITWRNSALAIMLVNKFFQGSEPMSMLYVLVIVVTCSLALTVTKPALKLLLADKL